MVERYQSNLCHPASRERHGRELTEFQVRTFHSEGICNHKTPSKLPTLPLCENHPKQVFGRGGDWSLPLIFQGAACNTQENTSDALLHGVHKSCAQSRGSVPISVDGALVLERYALRDGFRCIYGSLLHIFQDLLSGEHALALDNALCSPRRTFVERPCTCLFWRHTRRDSER